MLFPPTRATVRYSASSVASMFCSSVRFSSDSSASVIASNSSSGYASGEIEAAQFFRLCNAARVSHARREKLITLPRETRESGRASKFFLREREREREAVCVSSSRARVLRSRFSRRRDATFVEEDTVVVVASGTPVDEGERRGRFSR